MSKILQCAEVDPASGCNYVVRGETVEEIMENVKVHAVHHGIRDVTPELMEHVKAHIRDE